MSTAVQKTGNQTLLDLYQGKQQQDNGNIASTYGSLNDLLLGSQGFQVDGIYDITTCPGNAGKWDMVFDLILNCLSQNQDRKILMIQTCFNIPWVRLFSDKRWKSEYEPLIESVSVSSLSELISFFKLIFPSLNSNDTFGMALIDGFSWLYQRELNELIRLNSHNVNSNNNVNPNISRDLEDEEYEDELQKSKKRDYQGNNIINNSTRRINSLKTTNLIVQSFFQLLRKLINESQNPFMIVTLGLMTSVVQKFYKLQSSSKKQTKQNNHQDNEDNITDTDEDEEDAGSVLNQSTLVPMLPLSGPWSSYFTNRIILYKDWYNHKTQKSGIIKPIEENAKGTSNVPSVNLTIDYLTDLKNEDLVTGLHYLVYSINELDNSKVFNKGVFMV